MAHKRKGYNCVTYQYYINFKDKTEYVKHDLKFVTYPIGSLLLAMIDFDWQALGQEAAEARRSAFHVAQLEGAFATLTKRFSGRHVLLQRDFLRLKKTSDPLYAVFQWAGENERLKQRFLELIDQVLDSNGQNAQLTVLQRYYLLNKTNPDFRRFKQRMHEQLKVFQCMMCGGQPDEPTDVDSVSKLDITAAICYASDDLRTLTFMEFEYMVTEGLALHRCQNCGRYFLPYSVLTRYCDRIRPDGKTCREVAIRDSYQRRLQGDDIRTTYMRNNNAYQMRVRRSAKAYSQQDYQRWKAEARAAVEQWQRGEIAEEEALRRIALPEKRSVAKSEDCHN